MFNVINETKTRKMETINLLRLLLITCLFFSLVIFTSNLVVAADPWYDANWEYRKVITVNSTMVSEDLQNFPVLIDITDGNLTSKAQFDGDDILFADNTGIKLDHEIELYQNVSGRLIAWVRVNVSSTVDAVFYMYYGNNATGNQENPEGVWESNFVLVQHLDETSGTHFDSTLYNNDGSPLGGVNQTGDGKINGADEFDGTNDIVQVPSGNSISGFSNAVSISAWIKMNDTARRQSIVQKWVLVGEQRGYIFEFDDNNTPYGSVLGFFASTNGTIKEIWYTNFTPVAGNWYYLSFVWEADVVPIFYVNGTVSATIGTETISSIYDNNATVLQIGINTYISGRAFEGTIDEVRIADTTRSAGWLSTEYNNQKNPSNFIALGVETTGGLYYLNSSAGAGGSISPQGLIVVDEAGNKTFNIVPDEGYHITDIIVDTVSQGPSYTYTFSAVLQNHTISALFESTTPPIITLNKASYSKGATVTVTVTGGTSDKAVMIQINNPSGTPLYADQGVFDSSGNYQYQFKIPTSWSYGTHTVRVRDVDAGTTRSKTLSIPSPSPPPPPPPPPVLPPPVGDNKPVAEAGNNVSALVGHEIFFDGSESSDSDGTVVAYLWNMGDGNHMFVVNPSYVYSSVGTFNVTLTCVDDGGGTNLDWLVVTVVALPITGETGVDEGVPAEQTDYLVDALTDTNTTVTLDTTSPVTVSVFNYPENPYPEIPLPPHSLPVVVDIFVSDPDAIVWPIYVERHYSDSEVEGYNESKLGIYYYKEGAWHKCRNTGSFPANNTVWAYMFQDEVEGSPTIIVEVLLPADVVLSSLVIEPEVVAPGEEVNVSIKITNNGDLEGNYSLVMRIEGEIVDTVNGTIAPDSEETIHLLVSQEEPEIYLIEVDGLFGSFMVLTPASFQYTIVNLSPEEVAPGETVSVDVEVLNTGELGGIYEFTLTLDGVTVSTSSGELEGGEDTDVHLTVSSDTEGTHTVEVDGESDTFSVISPLTPADFQYTILTVTPNEIEPGDTANVDIRVVNTGEETGTYEFDLLLDGVVVETSSGELDGGEETLVFLIVSSETEGSRTLEVDGSIITLTVTTPAEPERRIPWLWVDLILIVIVIAVIYYLEKRDIISLPFLSSNEK